MRRISAGVLPLVFVIATSVSAPVRAQATTPDQPVIVAMGDSVLMLPPDRAYVQVAAEGRASKIAEAQRLAATAMTSVQAAVKGLGLPPDTMRTTSYVVQPEYDFNAGRQTFRDYLARNVVEVRVDDLARLSDVIDAAGHVGRRIGKQPAVRSEESWRRGARRVEARRA